MHVLFRDPSRYGILIEDSDRSQFASCTVGTGSLKLLIIRACSLDFLLSACRFSAVQQIKITSPCAYAIIAGGTYGAKSVARAAGARYIISALVRKI
jgi:hypothetical protein